MPILSEAGVHEIFRRTGDDEDQAVLSTHGEFTDVERVEIFVGVVQDVILPGFDGAGLDTRSCRAWFDGLSSTKKS